MSWDSRLYQEQHGFVWKLGAGLVELLAPQPDERILDTGCGTGQLTATLAEAGSIVTGIDRSPDMIAQARLNVPGVTFECAAIETYRPPEPFDAVFSNAALHWVHDAAAAAASISGALRPGGRFIAEFGGKGNVALVLGALHELTGLGNPWYFPSIGEYAAILEAAGLEVRNASLFDRPTCTEDPEAGLRNWLRMFGQGWPRDDEFYSKMEARLRPALFREGHWWIDYRRIRVEAVK